MGTRNVTKEKIVEALNELPQERLSEVSDFIAFLRFKSDREPRQLIQLGGVWSDYPPVTEEEIAERAQRCGGNLVSASYESMGYRYTCVDLAPAGR